MPRLIALLCATLLVAADQGIKWWASTVLSRMETMPIIENVLHLTYRENTGAAFSLLSGERWLLIGVTAVVIALMIAFVVANKAKSPYLLASLTLIISGGIGNLIDRIAAGFVVDYVDFRLIHFAIFNFADSCVCVGAGLLIVYFLFFEHTGDKRKGGVFDGALDL